jgi:hypothetical protein
MNLDAEGLMSEPSNQQPENGAQLSISPGQRSLIATRNRKLATPKAEAQSRFGW